MSRSTRQDKETKAAAAGSRVSRRQLLMGAAAYAVLPPFAFSKQRRDLLTFAPPSAMVALAPLTRSSVEHSLDDPESTLGGVGTLLWLLNECIEFHLVRLGLFVDRGRRRAYFPGLAQLPRAVAKVEQQSSHEVVFRRSKVCIWRANRPTTGIGQAFSKGYADADGGGAG